MGVVAKMPHSQFFSQKTAISCVNICFFDYLCGKCKKINKLYMAKLKDAKLKDLVFDNKNFNKHTEFGMSLIEKSLRNNGAGRSILIDKNNRIIAGNGVTEVAGQIGLDDVQIVETDGTKIIAVKRTDIDLDTKQGREMALADNATAAVDLEWDADAIADVESEFDIDASAWGVDVDFEDDAEQAPPTQISDESGWFLNIEFGSESQCEQLYNELQERGYQCKIIQ